MWCAADGSRLSQIVEWLGGEQFDGALVFDECHKAKNCIAKQGDKGRRQSESKTSRVSFNPLLSCSHAKADTWEAGRSLAALISCPYEFWNRVASCSAA